MKEEVERNLPKTHWTKDNHNPYFSKDDENLSKDHPKRIFSFRIGYINSDDLEKEKFKCIYLMRCLNLYLIA